MDWPEGEVRELALDEFDQRFARYRLQVDESTRQAMIASLRRFGQLSPVVVCRLGGLHHRLHRRRPAAGESIQLRVGLFAATISAFYRQPGHDHAEERTHAGLRPPGGRGGRMSL